MLTRNPDPYEAWLAEKEAESAQRAAAMREFAIQLARSLGPVKRAVPRTEIQADNDEEREFGWSVGNEREGPEP